MPGLLVPHARLVCWNAIKATLTFLEVADTHHALAAGTRGTWTTEITPATRMNANFTEFLE